MTYPAATLLRGWFYKQLRAVTNTPAHLSHVSNAALSTKHDIPDPVDQLEHCIRQKRDKLQTKENDITNTADIQHFWAQTHLAYKDLTTTALQGLSGRPCRADNHRPSLPRVRGLLSLYKDPKATPSTKNTKKLVTIDPEEAKKLSATSNTALMVCHSASIARKNLQTWGALSSTCAHLCMQTPDISAGHTSTLHPYLAH